MDTFYGSLVQSAKYTPQKIQFKTIQISCSCNENVCIAELFHSCKKLIEMNIGGMPEHISRNGP